MKYLIGIIKNTHGLKGEVLVKSLSDFDRFVKDEVIFLKINDKEIKLKIKDIRQSNKGLIISFYNIDHISEIEKYKGFNLYTNQEPELKEDEYHINDLIGKKVYDQNDLLIGLVKEVMVVPQGHILRIKREGKDALIPFNEAFVKEVKDIIKIKTIEGLL